MASESPEDEGGPWDQSQRAVLAELRSNASPAVLCLADRASDGGGVRFLREVCRALLDNQSTDELDLTVRARRRALIVRMVGGVRCVWSSEDAAARCWAPVCHDPSALDFHRGRI